MTANQPSDEALIKVYCNLIEYCESKREEEDSYERRSSLREVSPATEGSGEQPVPTVSEQGA